MQALLSPGTVIEGYAPGGYRAVRSTAVTGPSEPLRGEMRTNYGGRAAVARRVLAARQRGGML